MWPDDREPRFIVTTVSGFAIDPAVGRPGTSNSARLPISYQVIDRAYAHKLVREFAPKHGGYNILGYRRNLAERLCADLNRQDAQGLFDCDLTDADISPGVLA